MIDLTISEEESKEQSGVEVDAPKYPYGLKITLDDGILEKLGITSLPTVGTKMNFTAVAEVCSTSSYQEQSGEAETQLTLQITGMELNGSQASSDSQATLLYGN